MYMGTYRKIEIPFLSSNSIDKKLLSVNMNKRLNYNKLKKFK